MKINIEQSACVGIEMREKKGCVCLEQCIDAEKERKKNPDDKSFAHRIELHERQRQERNKEEEEEEKTEVTRFGIQPAISISLYWQQSVPNRAVANDR